MSRHLEPSLHRSFIKMKILFVHPAIRNYREGIFRKLGEAGWNFLFTMINPDGTHAGEDTARVLNSFQFKWFQCREIKNVRGLNNFSFDLWRVLRYDVVLFSCFTSVPFLLCAPILKLFGKKIVVFEETWKYQYSVKRYQLLLPYVRFLLKLCVSSFVVAGSRAREMLVQDFNISQNKIFIAYNTTLDLSEGIEDAIERSRIEELFKDFSKGRLVVLYLGRLVEIKAVDILIQAMTKVDEKACLLIVGEGELKNDLESLALRLGLSDRVKFLGAADPSEVGLYYSLSDISVLNSKFMPNYPVNAETWGFTLNEAMSLSIPVVASKAVGAQVDLIIDSETGMAVEENNVESLAEKINFLIADDERRERIGRNGRDHLKQTCSYDQNFEAFQNAVAFAIEKK